MPNNILEKIINLLYKNDENKKELKIILTPIIEILIKKINPIFYFIIFFFIVNFILLLSIFLILIRNNFKNN
jgi:hypothetical protein